MVPLLDLEGDDAGAASERVQECARGYAGCKERDCAAEGGVHGVRSADGCARWRNAQSRRGKQGGGPANGKWLTLARNQRRRSRMSVANGEEGDDDDMRKTSGSSRTDKGIEVAPEAPDPSVPGHSQHGR